MDRQGGREAALLRSRVRVAIMQGVLRTNDRRREEAVATLGEGYAGGCIGLDTFTFRVEAALCARTDRELRALTADLPAVREDAPLGVRIAPPPDGPGPWTMGRSEDCRMIIDADTVSRAHAALRRTPGGALEIRDLGSTNGTWVNGWRVESAVLAPGDQLVLGDVRVVFA